VTLVGARPILVACNLWFYPKAGQKMDQLLAIVQRVARRVRESGGGPAGLRTLALQLPQAHAVQLSMNVEQPALCSPSTLLTTVDAALHEAAPDEGPQSPQRFELIGLAPQHWLDALRAECRSRELKLDAAEHGIEHWVEESARMRSVDM
jgi:glutamate formiminotransferase